MLEKKIRRYKLMDAHRELVRKGLYRQAQLVLRLLREGKVTLWLDDDSWAVESLCEGLGCRIWYAGNGNKAVEALREHLSELEYQYEKALQSEVEAQIAYRAGMIEGVRKSLQILEKFI